ncbi:SAM-dependent methyltransferase [Cryptosporangium arvum]|uniref:SAM-dependent methyltransferase n=1 Tax=Cryptosporangium arvum TaxID=80871 RepID=UPI0004BBF995|nr:SAM-dependent methyltransferase [Cryptosporangium arvum]
MTGDRIDTTVVHAARRYDYWLGGRDNFAVDRESGDQIAALYPWTPMWARENRAFLGRAVEYLAGEAGIRQFLDVGTGLPTANNVHEVAQRVAPDARVLYVDNDPLVMAHARALLGGSPEHTAFLEADFLRPDDILAAVSAGRVLDLDQPVALMLVALVHLIPDAQHPLAAARTLLDALPSGSYLVMSHGTADFMSADALADVPEFQRLATFQMRSGAELRPFFDGTELVDPGLVCITDWRSPLPAAERPDPAHVGCYGAVGRKE